MTKIKTATFEYPDYGTPCGFPELKAHSGQSVTILRKLTQGEQDSEVEQLYWVKFSDGYEMQVFESELTFD